MRYASVKLVACCVAIAAATPAFADLYSPAGTWTTGGKDSRYEITLCGDGDDMCGRLVWLRDANADLTPYLNKTILDTARRIGNQTWRGSVVIAGHKARGTLTLVDRDTLEIRACNGAVCATAQLFRVD